MGHPNALHVGINFVGRVAMVLWLLIVALHVARMIWELFFG